MTEHENTNEVPLSIEAGTLLKNKRESLGMTQKQVADRLRLRVSVIEDIENNRFESQQVATFTRGYLRSYAKFVGLDEKVVLVALEQTADVKPKEQEIEMQSFSRKTKHEKHNSRIMLLTWVIAIVIIGISAAWWWQNQQENSLAQVVAEANVETSQPSADEIADIDLMTEEELIASTPAELAASNNTASESSINAAQTDEVVPAETEESTTEATQEPVDVIEAAEEVQDASPVVPEGMTLLTMKFKADCWIQVKDTNGKTLVSGTQKPGQDVELTGKAPFKVILGAPEGVTMTFASEPVDLSGYTSGKVARFTLPL
ncbi:helix-turn-helix domain-containing protein [Vibrio parahaemolyticus]|uniref:cytoskeleton protein RodZ n=1 Tax=Vibrio parahaemolyticus TaxID=670 RepID=UPI00111DA36A|nr:cytoskeleton protein RodZ [Vibrio parahaemolyticus]EIO4085545.1 cytoskeleton protein RodZ [Vibrio parahaemolyticus]TOL16799.1 helix-turn-helix domain-containing protein [Vibrio parahaemolyticus]TOL59373.1 helix-turn-helix domain-containing protein [Vibrio parahaemolyticus]TOL91934.1 helix-turn-helix domain-containing protein [Vibrio parahaemolyticus]HCE4734853.1 cytoskeleton protein RodZ [Vibrio parahaemolyticus]